MTIRFLCPSGHSLSVPDASAGKKVRCARCKRTTYVPQRSTLPKPSALPGQPGSSPPPLPLKRKPDEAKSAKAEAGPPAPAAETKAKPRRGPKAGSESSQPAAPSRRDTRRRRQRRPQRKDKEPATPGKEPSNSAAPPRQRKRTTPARARRGPALMPAGVYVPDVGKIMTVRWLAFFLALAVLFSLGPVIVKMHLNLAGAPWWARLALLLAVVQAVYILWMLSAPDWASVWVVMLVFATVAALYGMATAIALATPAHEDILLDMEKVRYSAKAWCGAVLLVMSLATYLCGRTSAKWRRAVELETAGKGKKLNGIA